MNQILHILRKDARHHWPEILSSLILLAAYFAEQPRVWAHKDTYRGVSSFLLESLPVLLFVNWALLIERLVHGESLVGERQFWITRPYEWPKLLAAKLLGMVLFIHVPVFLAQISLLAYGHFPVASAIPSLLGFHLGFALILIVPMMAIASVTSGTGSTTLTLLGLLVALIGLAAGFNLMPDTDLSVPAVENVEAGIFVVAGLSITLWQYVKRKAWPARLGIAGFVVLMSLMNLLAPRAALIAHSFPPASADKPSPAEFVFDNSLLFTHPGGESSRFSGDQVQVEIPLTLTGLVRDTVVTIWAVKLDFQTSSGLHVSSRWQNAVITLIPGRTRVWPAITLKRSVLDALQSRSAKAHLSLALNVYRETGASNVEVKDGGFAIPGGARCTSGESTGSLECFASAQQPRPGLITADLPAPHCDNKETQANEPYADAPAAYLNVPGGSGSDFDLLPVREFSLSAHRWKQLQDEIVTTPICPGTTLTFRTTELAYSNRIDVALGEIDVRDYVPSYPKTIRKRPGNTEAPPPDSATWLFDLQPKSGKNGWLAKGLAQ